MSEISGNKTNRREFLQQSALGAASVLGAGAAASAAAQAPAGERERPNFLFIMTDQQSLHAISAHGNPHVKTPNLDRLVARGVTFKESHSTNPVCSPARSSLFTGRMPVETGVITNTRPIHPDVPNMGQWFREAGYETIYSGKWHLPQGYPVEIPGFEVLPVGRGQGDIVDTQVARNCEAWLMNRSPQAKPFVMVASLMNPHDICYWAIFNNIIVPEQLPFEQLRDELPELPPNHKMRPEEPEHLQNLIYKHFNDEQWRYYSYCYYRQVEMVDAEIGRILDALDRTGLDDNTVIFFTSDHGEGLGRHMHVQKWYPYEESVKVPLIVSCPSRMRSGAEDAEHLVSGVDIMNTMCDYADIAPPHDLGMSLRPLLEGDGNTDWRDHLVIETHVIGRTVRTPRYKYVKYENDPVEMLFDMDADPWEMTNLYQQAKYEDVLKDHRKLLAEWNGRMKTVEPTGQGPY